MNISRRRRNIFFTKHCLTLPVLLLIVVLLLTIIPRPRNEIYLDREIDGALPKCVPHNELMTVEISHGAHLLNFRDANKTEFLPLAAYSYGNYAMVTTTADGYYGVPTVCRYFDEDFNELSPQHSSAVFPDFAVYCCTIFKAVYMSVTLTPTDNVVKYVKIVERPESRALKYEMSVCLSALYGGEPKWIYLVQMFEHYKLQEVTHFYVYIHEIDEYSKKLLLDYEDTGEAELTYFDKNDDRPAKNWQFVSIQDCIGRSRHESKYVILQDLDELFMATESKTLLDFATKKIRGSVGSIAVHPYVIVRTSDPPSEYKNMETLLEHLPILIFQNSSARTYKFRIKPIFNPAIVIGVPVHWVYLFEPGYKTYNSSMDEVFIFLVAFRNGKAAERLEIDLLQDPIITTTSIAFLGSNQDRMSQAQQMFSMIAHVQFFDQISFPVTRFCGDRPLFPTFLERPPFDCCQCLLQ